MTEFTIEQVMTGVRYGLWEPKKRLTEQDGAYLKGYEARLRDKPRKAPYSDERGGNHGQMITWSRGFIYHWEQGWDAANEFWSSREETNKRRDK